MKKVSVLAALFVSTAFLAMPVNAGRLATPVLPTFTSDSNWTYMLYVTNLGRHPDTYMYACYNKDGTHLFGGNTLELLNPGTTAMKDVFDFRNSGGLSTVRCEVEVKGSANDWRLMLCNYEYKYSGSNNDQCIEGR